jgi:hypothetical protein
MHMHVRIHMHMDIAIRASRIHIYLWSRLISSIVLPLQMTGMKRRFQSQNMKRQVPNDQRIGIHIVVSAVQRLQVGEIFGGDSWGDWGDRRPNKADWHGGDWEGDWEGDRWHGDHWYGDRV